MKPARIGAHRRVCAQASAAHRTQCVEYGEYVMHGFELTAPDQRRWATSRRRSRVRHSMGRSDVRVLSGPIMFVRASRVGVDISNEIGRIMQYPDAVPEYVQPDPRWLGLPKRNRCAKCCAR